MYNYSNATIKDKKESEKLCADLPVHTMRGSNTLSHYKHKRCLTIREYARRLQGFPDNYRFFGCATSMRQQIGNTVPCNTANAVVETIQKGCYPMM